MTNPPANALPDSPLVSVDWLATHLDDSQVRVLDASWRFPSIGQNSGQSARNEYLEGHIPGAGFFDLDAACDPDDPLPHTMPGQEHFTTIMQQLGIGKDDVVIFYDTGGFHTAARAWWMVQAFGHQRAVILDGGLTAWRAAGHAVESQTAPCPVGDFQANLLSGTMANANEVLAALESGSAQIVDARSPGRYAGSEPEPREGIRPGHMPGAVNICFSDLYGDDDKLRAADQLANLFARSGISTDKDIITTCGSGVTACCLALALEVLGKSDVRIYDGSWSEWGGRHDLPIATGAGKLPR